MVKKSFLALVLLLGLGRAVAADEQPLFEVEVRKDLVYGQAEEGVAMKDLLVDAFLPVDGSEKARPAVVIIHGGGFKSGSKEKPKFPEIAKYLTERGFACFSINYRLMDADLLATLQDEAKEKMKDAARGKAYADTKKAIDWLRVNHVEYGIDPDRIATLGGSAGAMCAFSAVVANEVNAVQAAVLLWGTDERLHNRINSNTSPIAIILGTEDMFFARAQALRDICKEQQVPYVYHPIEGAGHGPWRNLEAMENVKRWSYEFLAEHLQLTR